jgi:3-methyl-2-oxobutanoate hydroxymethyltransferase
MPERTVTINTLRKMKREGRKISCITSYDASFTRLIEAADAEVILVGDSLGMVVQGKETTLPVTMDEMVYHSLNVSRVRARSLLIVDMPFMSYCTATEALVSAGRLMKQGGAQMVKLEGGASQLETVRSLSEQGIPVCGHLGLQPQSVHKLGGYRVQGREAAVADKMLEDAHALQLAGADLLVLECVPTELAASVTREVSMPVIGIGAGAEVDGQVLVVYDMLGMTPNPPRFTKNFLPQAGGVQEAFAAFVREVREGTFPGPEQTFQ